ncbi:MAG: hypothetical protein VX410_02300, partial [Actinomycetota bacterium]|nr:hypothetical protein [Actinomycetota bacterium]
YFPNWSAKGAVGPYRATPNWMIVIPTENNVELEFAATWAEYLGWLLTSGGIAVVVLLLRTKRREPVT